MGNPAAKNCRAEHRESERALNEVERERGETATRPEEQTHSQNSEVLQRQRNRCEGQRHSHARTQGDEEACGDYDRCLLRPFLAPVLGSCALSDNLSRYSRHGLPFSIADVAAYQTSGGDKWSRPSISALSADESFICRRTRI